MKRFLASLVFFLAASSLWAQINLSPEYRLGQRIVGTTDVTAKGYDWSCPTADVLSNGNSCFIWSTAGTHTLTLITVDADYKISRTEKTFKVTSDPVPPTPATLRELVSAEEAKKISEYLRALASQVSKIDGAAQFWSVWQQTFPVQGNAKLDAALKARLDPAIEKQKGLSVELLAIANEFEKDTPKPPTPEPLPVPVTEGRRNIVIVNDSGNPDTSFDGLIVQLRKPGTPSQSFLSKGGHVLDVLDSDQIADSKWNSLLGGKLENLPKLFIIDPKTNSILFESVIATGTTADNVTEKIRQTGG